MLFPRLRSKHRRWRVKLLFTLLFAALAVCGIILEEVHRLKSPVATPPTVLDSGVLGNGQ